MIDMIVVLKKEHVDFSVTARPEIEPVRGNAIASGDPEADKAVEDDLLRRIDRGDVWAWCTVTVAGTIRGTQLSAENHLGCCSYTSQAEFEAGGGYYNSMKNEVLEELTKRLREIVKSGRIRLHQPI